MGSILFDLYLQLEYGNEEQSLSGAVHDCSLEIMRVATNAISDASAYFNRDSASPQFSVSEESLDIAE